MAKCPKCDAEYEQGTHACVDSVDQPEVRSASPKPDYARIVTRALKGYWPMWLAGILFVLAYWDFPFADWWKDWRKPHSYYSHGPLVPFIALFMIWANRKRIALVKIQPSWLGLLLLVPSVPIFVFGRWTGSGVLCAATFFTFIIGALLLFTGRQMTKLLLFPVLYLVFMIPAPATVLDNATFKIQFFSTTLAAKMLSLTYDVTQVGSTISGGGLPDDLRVGTACSGFRMLIALLTFTAFFVYMLRSPKWKKLVLVAVAFPLSTFVNGLRIALIGYIGIWTGSARTMHKFHDTWAMAFELVVSFAILFGFARLIKANDFGVPEPTDVPEPSGATSARKFIGADLKGAAVIAVFVLVMLMNSMVQPLETTARGRLDKSAFPKVIGNWAGEDLEVDPMTAQELKTADMLQRMYHYRIDDLPPVQVLVQAAADTDAFHDPHSCIPGGGSHIIDERTINIRFQKPRPMTAHATVLTALSPMGDEFVLIYWYDTESQTYATTSQVRWRMRLAQLKDIRDLLLRRVTNEEVRKRSAKRQTYCYRFSSVMGVDKQRDYEALLSFIRDFIAHSRRPYDSQET